MISLLGLHGSSGHPGLIEPFLVWLAPELPRACPQGTFKDGDGHTFFKRRPDRTIPSLEVMALAKQSIAAANLVPHTGRQDTLLVGYSSGAIFANALLAVAPKMFVGAFLLRPEPLALKLESPALENKPVLIISGKHDGRRRPSDGFVVARNYHVQARQ